MVHQVITCIRKWVDPFKADQSICHLTSGRIAPDDLVGNLLQCHERDTKALEDFAQNRLDVTGKQISVTTCQNICFTAHPFTDTKSANYSQINKELCCRLLVIGQNCDISFNRLLSTRSPTFGNYNT